MVGHAASGPASPKTLLVEGWRGVNQSIAIINQQQLLEMLKFEGLRLYHNDLPFAFGHWQRQPEMLGFTPTEQAAIDALAPPPSAERIDCVYRIGSPVRAGATEDRRHTVTFMITEIGLTPSSFHDGAENSDFFTRGDNCIVTASEWSRARLIDHGYGPEKVHVVPLGVDRAAFSPLPDAQRLLARARMGFHPDETVFVNVGVALWNKGIDVLLRAFAVLRARGRRVRLVLKDQRDVYGVSVEHLLGQLQPGCPALREPDILAAITVIPQKLDRAQLRQLYGIADAYVSPYRAEGFNLPALEAIACATPLIVTAGGATDDFCTDALAWRIPGRMIGHVDPDSGAQGQYLEPELDALVAAMDARANGVADQPAGYEAAREDVLRRFTWAKAAARVAALAVGLDVSVPPEPASAAPPPRPVRQHEVRALLGLLRPMAMASGGKRRVGNEFDGGYILPDRALGCDGVLSIGVGHDVSFDLAFAERGALVMQFDHTVACSPIAHPKFHFHRLGWGARTEDDLLGTTDMLALFHRLQPRRPLLKFDVEGAEYAALAATTAEQLAGFDVIVCELHDLHQLGDRDMFARVWAALAKLTRHHAPVHLHANNYRGVALVAGVAVPDVVELTLLRRDIDDCPNPSDEEIPGLLDRPNNPMASDICLRLF
jgi:glycosyltransferase involved in cell wall biosynthesis